VESAIKISPPPDSSDLRVASLPFACLPVSLILTRNVPPSSTVFPEVCWYRISGLCRYFRLISASNDIANVERFRSKGAQKSIVSRFASSLISLARCMGQPQHRLDYVFQIPRLTGESLEGGPGETEGAGQQETGKSRSKNQRKSTGARGGETSMRQSERALGRPLSCHLSFLIVSMSSLQPWLTRLFPTHHSF
jgi:hypothetical protein